MTDAELSKFRGSRAWNFGFLVQPRPLAYRLDVNLGLRMCVTPSAYAECAGPDDPHCGRCRFSSHGCGGAPTRSEYLAWISR